LVHSTKKSMTEYGEKLEAAEKEKIEAGLKDLEEAIKGEDKDAIVQKQAALEISAQKLGEKMYADMQASQAANAAATGAAGAAPDAEAAAKAKAHDDNVVDAEVKEVKKG
jgi:molecular chaperone DnaK